MWIITKNQISDNTNYFIKKCIAFILNYIVQTNVFFKTIILKFYWHFDAVKISLVLLKILYKKNHQSKAKVFSLHFNFFWKVIQI